MVTARQVINSTKPKSFKDQGVPGGYQTPLGAIGYDNVRDDIEKAKKVRELTIGSYMMPKVDGTANQIIETDGSGTLSWINSPPAHATTHETGGTDVVTITHAQTTGQTVDDHHAEIHDHVTHTNIGADDHHPQLHAAEHEGGGGDLITHNNLNPQIDDHHARDHELTHRNGGADELNHDNLAGFVVNEHIDWTNAVDDLSTTGDITGGDRYSAGDYRIILNDAAGATRFRIMDNTLGSVYSCDSNGNIVTYGLITFNISGGTINQVGAGLVCFAGNAAGDFWSIAPSSVDADMLTLTGGAGLMFVTPVVNTSAQSWFNNGVTTGVCHDTIAASGSTGSGYKITVDPTVATGFKCIHVICDPGGGTQDVHTVDEQGLISNWDSAGNSRWKRRTWKGCNEMDNTVQTPMTNWAWPGASHYKILTATPSGSNSLYWSTQIPHDWDGISNLRCMIRIVTTLPLIAGQQLSWNMAMSCEQAGDIMGANGQSVNGFLAPGMAVAGTIYELPWQLNYQSVPGPLQPGDEVNFHFYCIGLGSEGEWEEVGVIGAWCEYQSIYPEIPTGTT